MRRAVNYAGGDRRNNAGGDFVVTRDATYDAVSKILIGMGVKQGTKRCAVCAEAVYQVMKNPGAIYGQWCSQILPDTAEALGMSYYAVCRALGMLLDEIREMDGSAEAKRKIGLTKNDPLTDRKDFVYRIAMLVKKKSK